MHGYAEAPRVLIHALEDFLDFQSICVSREAHILTLQSDFLQAGASALGIGGALVEKEAVANGDLARIESLAKQYVQIVRETRAAM